MTLKKYKVIVNGTVRYNLEVGFIENSNLERVILQAILSQMCIHGAVSIVEVPNESNNEKNIVTKNVDENYEKLKTVKELIQFSNDEMVAIFGENYKSEDNLRAVEKIMKDFHPEDVALYIKQWKKNLQEHQIILREGLKGYISKIDTSTNMCNIVWETGEVTKIHKTQLLDCEIIKEKPSKYFMELFTE